MESIVLVNLGEINANNKLEYFSKEFCDVSKWEMNSDTTHVIDKLFYYMDKFMKFSKSYNKFVECEPSDFLKEYEDCKRKNESVDAVISKDTYEIISVAKFLKDNEKYSISANCKIVEIDSGKESDNFEFVHTTFNELYKDLKSYIEDVCVEKDGKRGMIYNPDFLFTDCIIQSIALRITKNTIKTFLKDYSPVVGIDKGELCNLKDLVENIGPKDYLISVIVDF